MLGKHAKSRGLCGRYHFLHRWRNQCIDCVKSRPVGVLCAERNPLHNEHRWWWFEFHKNFNSRKKRWDSAVRRNRVNGQTRREDRAYLKRLVWILVRLKNCSSGLLASLHPFTRSHTVRLLYGYVNNASLDLNSDFFFSPPEIHIFLLLLFTLLFKCGPYQTPLGSGSSPKTVSAWADERGKQTRGR